MKTYLKGIKTVAVIFLSLLLFSCQDEQIEPIDTLSTAPNEINFKRGGNGGGDSESVEYFLVELIAKDTKGNVLDDDNVLKSSGCEGTCSSKQTLFWFADSCPVSIVSEGIELSLQAIRPWVKGDDNTTWRLSMHDTDGELYRTTLGGPMLEKLQEGNWNFSDDGPFVLEKKIRKGKDRGWIEVDQKVQLGEIVLRPKTD